MGSADRVNGPTRRAAVLGFGGALLLSGCTPQKVNPIKAVKIGRAHV